MKPTQQHMHYEQHVCRRLKRLRIAVLWLLVLIALVHFAHQHVEQAPEHNGEVRP